MTTHESTGHDARELAQLRLERHHHSDDDLDGVIARRGRNVDRTRRRGGSRPARGHLEAEDFARYEANVARSSRRWG
jgi:hypothetical protein